MRGAVAIEFEFRSDVSGQDLVHERSLSGGVGLAIVGVAGAKVVLELGVA